MGKVVASKLGVPFLDAEVLRLKKAANMSIPKFFILVMEKRVFQRKRSTSNSAIDEGLSDHSIHRVEELLFREANGTGNKPTWCFDMVEMSGGFTVVASKK